MIHAPNFKELGTIEHGFGTIADEGWLDEHGHAWAKQIHSDIVLQPKTEGPQGDGDALITTSPELWVSVRTADCLPILMVDPVGRIVAAVHAGWRGTAAGIAAKTLRAMQERGAMLADLRAAIGPGIGLCCFEVGPEVSPHFGQNGRACVDLAAANERQLMEAGLGYEQIWLSKRCTRCEADTFHSYRRDGAAAGRMVSAIRLLQ